MFWIPTSAQEILDRLDKNQLTESKHLELKQQMPRTESIAKLLSSFANQEGGVAIFGVAEQGGTYTSAPMSMADLHRLSERICQLAQEGVDEPLPVAPRILTLEENPTVGFMVVVVARSARAPHMVAQTHLYYGRTEKQSYLLSQREVEDLYQQRVTATHNAITGLDTLIQKHTLPVNEDCQQLYLAIVPTITGSALVTQDRIVPRQPHPIATAYSRAGAVDSTRLSHWNTDYPTRTHFTPLGHILYLQDDSRWAPDGVRESKNCVDLHVNYDGSGLLCVGRVGDTRQGVPYLFEEFIAIYTQQFLTFWRELYTLASYNGSVTVMVIITNLQDTYSYYRYSKRGMYFILENEVPFPDEQYQQSVIVTVETLTQPDTYRQLLQALFNAMTQGLYNPFNNNP